jgi:adenine-specific DNA-methyltransferase
MRYTLSERVKTKKLSNQLRLRNLIDSTELFPLQLDQNPYKAIETGKLMAKVFFNSFKDETIHLTYSNSFIYLLISTYWNDIHSDNLNRPLPKLFVSEEFAPLDISIVNLALALGHSFAKLDTIEASSQLGNLYTSIIPEDFQSSKGIFYTPQSLANRLIDMIEQTGIDWSAASVIDPACGGGAFLVQILKRMLKSMEGKTPSDIIYHIERHLIGYDIDPFAAWLSQVFIEAALKDFINDSGLSIRPIIKVVDSLRYDFTGKFDVIVGNPPYGKTRLSSEAREKYQSSLFGHANLYGVFMHVALNLVKDGGVIGYLTPTSFLSGEYFKNLRKLLRTESTPKEIDFVYSRKGVFEDVLQETMLSIYVKETESDLIIKVNGVNPTSSVNYDLSPIGKYKLPDSKLDPWLLPRDQLQGNLVRLMSKMNNTLLTWGYRISTGPLVWNRYKEQLNNAKSDISFPVIWAESITSDGCFFWKSEKKNHSSYFHAQKQDQWLITNKPCILLQRTTAKEQHKRLIASCLPMEFISKYDGVIIENHLNMIIPNFEDVQVPANVLSVFINSKVVNDAFRALSGSVAISAYELKHLPLPEPYKMKSLEILLKKNPTQEEIEDECLNLYS